MKKILATAMAVAVMAAAGSAFAANSAIINVSATVTGTCMLAGPGTINFGALDPTNPIAVSAASAGITVTCTNGTAYTLTDASANGYTLVSGANNFPYSVSYINAGVGTGAPVAVAITGDIAANAYATAPAGAYTDTITLSVVP